MRLKRKVALITGGSRGIGKETAKLFAREGATVVITSKNQVNLKKAIKDILNSYSIPADIRNERQVQNVVNLRFTNISISEDSGKP